MFPTNRSRVLLCSSAIIALLATGLNARAEEATGSVRPSDAPAGLSQQVDPVVDLPLADLPPAIVDMTPNDGSFTLAVPDLPAMPGGFEPATPDIAVKVPLPDLPDVGAAFAATPANPAPASPAPASSAPAQATRSVMDPVTVAAAIEASLVTSEATAMPRLGPAERDAIDAFYKDRHHAPLWVINGAWNEAAKAVLATLASADEDGLRASDYAPPLLPLNIPGDASEYAQADIRLSTLAVSYARDARGGRIPSGRLSKLITPNLDIPAPADVLNALAASADPKALLASYHPPHEGYRLLKRELAALRAARPATPLVSVPQGPIVRPGMRDPRIPLVRARFGLGPSEPGSDTTYDERLASAVASFQKDNGLPASGILNRQTVAALSGQSDRAREADLIANMERWRWLPGDLGARHIFVNTPEFTLRLFDKGNVAHQTRVIIGKPETPTPIFSDEMEHVVVNPSWYVPPSILKNEFLPNLAVNPNYAAERGYVVTRSGNSISVRQPPGERNALGFIKFMFPNQHAVYLHDTPSRRLFTAQKRAFSHGCVRVDQPFLLADFIFAADPTWDEKRLKSLIGKGERTIRLPAKIPVHLTYFTLSVDSDGKLVSFADIYGFNARVKAALRLGA